MADMKRGVNKRPIVSIIVPAYNVEKYIQKCINSLLIQTLASIEIIIINDGSTDGTNAIIRDNYNADMRIKYICQSNQGVACARNVGVDHAEGKYILFVDGDDYLDKEYIEKLVECAEKNNSELVIAGYTMIDEYGKLLHCITPWKYVSNKDESVAYCICAVCSRLYRRDFWINNDLNFVNEVGSRGEDTPIAMKANLLAQNICTVVDAGYYYVQHEKSAMVGLIGLRKYHFPYHTLEKILADVEKINGMNSKGFFYVGVYKFLAQFVFQLARGASQADVENLVKYIYRICDEFSDMRISMSMRRIILGAQWGAKRRIATMLLTILIKYHCLECVIPR